uniref:RING-type E3 ubiquitin transferase n=1 Tax=Geospiza parvula TaxID=87175 RepID=A0A8C3MES6_GEOPR
MGDAAPAEPPEPRAARCRLFNSSMRSAASRLRTFQQWPRAAPVSARDLVDAGFFYVGPGDEVQCFCCGGVLKDWRPGDCPLIEHVHFFPSCQYVRGESAGNQEMLSLQEIFDTVDGQFLSVLQGIVSEETAMPNEPEYPEMVTEEMRLSTFENWPQNSSMHPEQLARAGFFYTGSLAAPVDAACELVIPFWNPLSQLWELRLSSFSPRVSVGHVVSQVSNNLLLSLSGRGDVVRCFYCDGGVRSWSLGDDPWREHAKWYPEMAHFCPKLCLFGKVLVHCFTDPLRNWKLLAHPSEDQSLIVQNVLQMGFDPTWVANLVENKFALTGTFYLSESELISDLLQPESQLSTEEQLRRLQEERMCKVCMDRDVSVVFVPCGHLVACEECALNLRLCPICRAAIRGTVRAFMS